MAMTKTEAAGAQEWTARPNCSLTPTARRNLVCGILAISLLVSGGFLLAGAWLVLPFAGLDLDHELILPSDQVLEGAQRSCDLT